jgi:hypothetical protein
MVISSPGLRCCAYGCAFASRTELRLRAGARQAEAIAEAAIGLGTACARVGVAFRQLWARRARTGPQTPYGAQTRTPRAGGIVGPGAAASSWLTRGHARS